MDSGQEVMQKLIARGLSPVQAAALAGHMAQESGYNPNAYNPKEGAFGGVQWRLDRRDNLNKFASDRGAKPGDMDTQLDFILHEMAGPEAKAGSAFLAGKDLPTVHAALKRYIRYGDNSDAARLGEANRLLGGGAAQSVMGMSAAPPAAPAAVPFGLTATEAAPAAVNPQIAAAIQAIPKQAMQEEEPMEVAPLQMARPLGLARVRELLAAMNRQGGAA